MVVDSVVGLDDNSNSNINDKTLVLVSKEGKEFTVSPECASLSGLIKTLMEECDDQERVTKHHLPRVPTAILEMVVKFWQFHQEKPLNTIEKPLTSADMKQVVNDERYADFIDVEQDILFRVVEAANYLNIPPLLDLGCAKIASMIKGKTTEQIRETFNIGNDFTPEEEAEIREENKWAELET